MAGQEIVQGFQNIKNRRDRYLREEWTAAKIESSSDVFRQIDYDYLLTSLRNYYSDSDEELFRSYLSIIRTCLQFGELQKAHDLLQVVENNFTDVTADQRTQFLMLKGKWALYAGETDQAQSAYNKALDLFTERNETQGIIKALNNLGILSYQLWETKQGSQCFERADQIIRQTEREIDAATIIFVRMNLGIIDGMQGGFARALDRFEQIEEEFPTLEGISRLKILVNKGAAFKHLGKLNQAREVLSPAVEGARSLPDYNVYGDALLELAEVEILDDNFIQGMENLSVAFKLFSKIHDQITLADAYRIFGILYIKQGYYELAESQFDISINIAKEHGNLLYLTECYYEYSVLAEKLGRVVAQRQHLQTSLAYARAMDAEDRTVHIKTMLDSLS